MLLRVFGFSFVETMMMYKLACGIGLLLMASVAGANPTQQSPAMGANIEQKLSVLSEHKQWRHLLFYRAGRGEVISPNFYLTKPLGGKNLRINPHDELVAMVKALDDDKVVCQYPARAFWLSSRLGRKLDLTKCPNLPQADSPISLILVGSYLKNPASTFGHVLIRSGHKSTDADELLSESYNFGARIPQNENGVLYALKGLFGVYDASFSKADFFTQDAVYSQNEQRDMWEYPLNLNEHDTRLLNYHLHEASHARFDYYFLKQNCGYRSGELLELVSDLPMTKRVGGWYAPEYVFDQLMTADELSSQVRYIPSMQTRLRQQFVTLKPALQGVINDFIKHENQSVLQTLGDEDRALVLEFLIAHRNYKLSQDKTAHHEAVYNALVAQRLTLPAGKKLPAMTFKDSHTPTLSPRTTKTQVGIDDEGQLSLGLYMFSKDPLDTATALDKKFEAMHVVAKHQKSTDKVVLDSLTVLEIEQIENIHLTLEGEPKMSWGLKAGVAPDVFDKDGHLSYAQASVGVGGLVSENVLWYGMGGAMVHDVGTHLDAQARAGVRVKQGKFAVEANHALHLRDRHKPAHQSTLTLRRELGKRQDVRLVGSYRHDTHEPQASLTWQYYW